MEFLLYILGEEWRADRPASTFEPINVLEGNCIANSLSTGKAPGPDGVPDSVVRALPFAKSNEILRYSVFPADWKVARLILLRKPGKTLGLTLFLPTSELVKYVKIFERVVKRRIEAHLETIPQGGLTSRQFDFRKGHSTVHALEAVSKIV